MQTETNTTPDATLDHSPVAQAADHALDDKIDEAPIPATTNYLVCHHPNIDRSGALAETISAYLQQQPGIQVETYLLNGDTACPDNIDIFIALGGDGTMLRVGRLAAPQDRPVLGINLGRLGFLHEIQSGDWRPAIERMLQDEYWLETRMMLRASHYRGEQHLGSYDALNDVVIARGRDVRPLRLETYIDGGYMTHYMADGLIVATSTGSTAYALAVGGPILPPESQNMLLVPIAPHLSFDRAIVFPRRTEIDLIVHIEHDAVFSADGQLPIEALDGDRFHIATSPHHASFIRFQERAYFYQNLRDRMVIHINPAANKPKKS